VSHVAEGLFAAPPSRGRTRPVQRVLINGAGGAVGTFALQLAKAFAAEVPCLHPFRGTKDPGDRLAALRDGIEARQITPVIGRTFPLSDVPEAMRYLETGQARGKVVITV
jgi:NADPH:quinone reductase-like Zn-dependent oxidoreductase